MREDNCTCGTCGKTYYKVPSVIANGRGKFCSRNCAQKAHELNPVTWKMGEEGKEKIRQAQLKRYKGRKQKVKCENCQREFSTTIARLEDGRGRYCSNDCKYACSQGGPEETRFQKGLVPWNIGMDEALSVAWKGDKAGYAALHTWVKKHLGRPEECESCGSRDKSKRYEWANRSGEYKRELDDWLRLCTSCHKYYDDRKGPTAKFIFDSSNGGFGKRLAG